MKMQRNLLIATLGVIAFMLLIEWTAFKEQLEEAQLSAIENADSAPANTPPIIDGADITNMTAPAPDSAEVPSLQAPTAQPSMAATSNEEPFIDVVTSNFQTRISLIGGDITDLSLSQFLRKVDKDDLFALLEQNVRRTYVAQSGLIGPNGTDTAAGRPLFTAESSRFEMQAGDNSLAVNLRLQQDDGTIITKRFTFYRDSYTIDVDYIVDNRSNSVWQAALFGQIKRDNTPDPGADTGRMGVQPFLGFATKTADEPYLKFSFDDINEKTYDAQSRGSWIAMVQHYFISAWIPAADQDNTISMLVSSTGMNIGRFTGPLQSVQPGQSSTISATFYAGPKDQYSLEQISSGLDLTVDYGWLWWIAQPLFALLHFFATGELHIFGKVITLGSGIGNWGWSIILLTLCVKAAFFHLSATSYRSMAKMRALTPKMTELRERYGDDRQKLSQETMDLYRREKVNPLGGCLPILIQMPVFIALYWVLLESVELRHAPWALWIKDLSVMDPYFVLPLIMGASMYFQQSLNPPPPDPMQAKIFKFMPIMFTVFFLFFPAGLVLYWVVNNLLSIAQQYVITKQIEKATQSRA